MKEKILELRNQGMTYSQIKNVLNCSKSTISYHCSNGQKEKTKNRTKKRRKNILVRKVETFKYRRRKNVVEAIRKFQKREGNSIKKNIEKSFTFKDILEKFGSKTICYMSGKEIDLLKDEDFTFDHIIPVCKGGKNTLDNLGICKNIINYSKSGLLKEDFINLCKDILEHQGYKITKNTQV